MRHRRRCLVVRQRVLAEFGDLALRSDDLDEVLTEACRLVAERAWSAVVTFVKQNAPGFWNTRSRAVNRSTATRLAEKPCGAPWSRACRHASGLRPSGRPR